MQWWGVSGTIKRNYKETIWDSQQRELWWHMIRHDKHETKRVIFLYFSVWNIPYICTIQTQQWVGQTWSTLPDYTTVVGLRVRWVQARQKQQNQVSGVCHKQNKSTDRGRGTIINRMVKEGSSAKSRLKPEGQGALGKPWASGKSKRWVKEGSRPGTFTDSRRTTVKGNETGKLAGIILCGIVSWRGVWILFSLW